ncbi:MAG: lytic murein transglycosylase B [Pseudomonadota bacterium]
MKLLYPLLLASALTVGAAAHAAPANTKSSAAAKARQVAAAEAKRLKLLRTRVTPRVDYAGEQVNFTQWQAVNDFADEIALRHGIPRAELTELIGKIRFIESAIQLVRPPPVGKPKDMNGVRTLMIEPVRVNAGVKFWNEHAATLARAEAEFGVPAEIIVGIIGIETVYGRNTGRFRVLDVLATLAFAYPETPNKEARMRFFRGELENALLLARTSNIDPFSMLGSFAGAIGMPQFMPSNVLAYGVDYDNNGQVDLRNSPTDVIGSVGNFLINHGWKRAENGPLVYRAQLSEDRNLGGFLNQGLAAKFSIDALRAGGVGGDGAPAGQRLYGLVDLQNGKEATEYWLATNNFFTITQYNRSYFYAMSVLELGAAVRDSRGSSARASLGSL